MDAACIDYACQPGIIRQELATGALAYVKGFLRNGWGNQKGIENRVLRRKSTCNLPRTRSGKPRSPSQGSNVPETLNR